MDSARIGVAAAEDIAAEGKIAMGNTELSEQGGSEVGLVADGLDAARLSDGSACPDDGDAVALWVGLCDACRIADAVVGQND